MIHGAHFLLYTPDPEADRAFFRNVLALPSVDAGEGWLIFRLPPSELALHPADEPLLQPEGGQDMLGAVLYLMCDDVKAQTDALRARKIGCTPPKRAPWGMYVIVDLPSGGKIGLYQPSHATAIERPEKAKGKT